MVSPITDKALNHRISHSSISAPQKYIIADGQSDKKVMTTLYIAENRLFSLVHNKKTTRNDAVST